MKKMKELIAGKYVERKSRFFTHLYEINDESEIINILKSHRAKYKKANHHVFAILIKDNDKIILEKSNDDGEVGHPGRILMEILKKYNLSKNIIVVSRIFGGIKLGIGGVSKAFKNAADETISYYKKQN